MTTYKTMHPLGTSACVAYRYSYSDNPQVTVRHSSAVWFSAPLKLPCQPSARCYLALFRTLVPLATPLPPFPLSTPPLPAIYVRACSLPRNESEVWRKYMPARAHGRSKGAYKLCKPGSRAKNKFALLCERAAQNTHTHTHIAQNTSSTIRSVL